MYMLHLKNFMFFLSLLISLSILSTKTDVLSMSLSNSQEIRDIFYGSSEKNEQHENIVIKESPKHENYPINIMHKNHNVYSIQNQKSYKVFENDYPPTTNKKNGTTTNGFIHKNETKMIEQKSIEPSENIISVISTKLNEVGSNLFLGVPEVIHINATSSIKPRKGVFYNKIVPRKGVETENEEGSYAHDINFCNPLWSSENHCYNAIDTKATKCLCCKFKKGIGAYQLPLMNCSNCLIINNPSSGIYNCQYICCKNKNFDTFNSVNVYNKKNDILNLNKSVTVTLDEFKKNISFKHAKLFVKSKKDKFTVENLKPEITKVPYDVEVVTDLFTNSKRNVFIPVAATIFLVPLFATLIFFIWRWLKDYWEKRYYRRMDFLIDGMYND